MHPNKPSYGLSENVIIVQGEICSQTHRKLDQVTTFFKVANPCECLSHIAICNYIC